MFQTTNQYKWIEPTNPKNQSELSHNEDSWVVPQQVG